MCTRCVCARWVFHLEKFGEASCLTSKCHCVLARLLVCRKRLQDDGLKTQTIVTLDLSNRNFILSTIPPFPSINFILSDNVKIFSLVISK